jgi:DNA helicase IV
MSAIILERLHLVDPYATIAVILPTRDEAERWYNLLQEELVANHRPALLSQRDDLTRRFDVHFTDVRETKGLEFNVVVVPDLGAFELESEIGLNQVYVAMSRAKHASLLGCNQQSTQRYVIKQLLQHQLIRIVGMPPRLKN